MYPPRNSIVSLSILLFALGLGDAACAKERKKAAPAAKATPTAKATPEPREKAAPAYVRVWKSEWPGEGAWQLQVQAVSAKTPDVDMALEPKKVTFSDYLEVPSGAAKLTLKEAEKEGAKPQTISWTFPPAGFFTVLVKDKGGEPVVEIIDDAPTGSDEQDAELTVRNFASGLTEIRVHASDVLDARLRAPGGYLYLRGLERKVLLIEATTRNAAGSETKWTNEADFRAYRKVTLLIFTDSYGRVRPRLVPDGTQPGKAKSEETEKAEQ